MRCSKCLLWSFVDNKKNIAYSKTFHHSSVSCVLSRYAAAAAVGRCDVSDDTPQTDYVNMWECNTQKKKSWKKNEQKQIVLLCSSMHASQVV